VNTTHRIKVLLSAALLVLPARLLACELEFAYANQVSSPYITEAKPDSALPGLAVEIIAHAAAAHGCHVKFVRRPGKRVLAEVAANQHTGALMFSYSVERQQSTVFPLDAAGKIDSERRLARLYYYLYRMSDSKLEWDGHRFRNLDGAIGVNLGYAVAADLQALGAKVEEVPTTAQNLEKLRLGRIAAYAMHDFGVEAALHAPQYSKVERMPIALSVRDYYLTFSPRFYRDNKALAERIWDELPRSRDKLMRERVSEYMKKPG
jgi:polar amino acid transport system substrate-binding protein